MINIPFSKQELNAITQSADVVIKAGGLQNARILVPICDRIDAAIAADEAKTQTVPATTNAGGESTQS